MYLDPAFGGMLVQIIVAIIAVGGGVLYSFRRKIRALFSKDGGVKRKKRETTEEMVDTLASKDDTDGAN